MFRTLKLLQRVANIEPHKKSITALGINNRKLYFNPTYKISDLEYLKFIKLLL